MSNKYFKEIPINSEADLPKEEGEYFVTLKDGRKKVYDFYRDSFNEVDKELWANVASYQPLLPAEPGVLYEKVSVDNSVSLETTKKMVGKFMNWFCSHENDEQVEQGFAAIDCNNNATEHLYQYWLEHYFNPETVI